MGFFGIFTQCGPNIYHSSSCSELERRCRTEGPNRWAAKDCRALKHPRDILFIPRQSGICFFELMTCVIQGALQVFGSMTFLLTRQVLELKKKQTKKRLLNRGECAAKRRIFVMMQLVAVLVLKTQEGVLYKIEVLIVCCLSGWL